MIPYILVFCALPGLPRYWEVSNNPKTTITTLEDWYEVVWVAKKKLNKLSRWERLKVLPRIPEQWWKMNQQKTLTVGNLNYVVEPSLVVSSTTPISLPKIYIPLPCEVYLPAPIRFQTFCLTPTNPMQPPFSMWYNPDKRCDVMVGSSNISIEQFQEF